MASGPARAALIGAWFVVIGGLAGGAAYLHSLGDPPGPPVLTSPEPAPEPQAPPRLDPPQDAAAPDEPAQPDDLAASPEPTEQAEPGIAERGVAVLNGLLDLPQLPDPSGEPEAVQGGPAIDLQAETLETLGGTGAAAAEAEASGDGVPALADLAVADDAAAPERFAPQTAWPVETPSLHGPMPMLPRQSVDLAALGDTQASVSDAQPPPVLAPPPAAPESADQGQEPVPAVPEPAEQPDEAPALAADDHQDVPPPSDAHQTMAEDGHAAPPEPVTQEAAADPPGHQPPVAEPEVDEAPPPVVEADEPAVVAVNEPPAAPAEPDSATEMAETATGLSTEPDERVVEVAEVGPLPVVGPGGTRPAEVYARPFDVPGNRPVVAVVVGGLGLSSAATEAAIQSLPAAVTLSFSPYSGRLQDWVARARAAGHEVLIDLPMEPVDFPHSDPGPQALMTSLDAEANMQRLEWVLSRATNYIGVGSYMGSRFAADAAAMRPVLQAINARGLIYLDNGQAIGEVAPTLSAEIGLPVLVSDLEVDQMAARQVIDDSLAQLEAMAMRDGAALAIGTAYPVTIERLAVWTRSLADRGLALAPASALAR